MSPRDSEDILLNWIERVEGKLDLVIADRANERVAIEARLTALESKRSTSQKLLLAFASFGSGIAAWLLNR